MGERLRRTLTVAAAAVFLGSGLLAQSQKPEDLAPGKILVTPRESPDPLFAQSVILLVQYEESGAALGLMLNTQTEIHISEALAPLKGAKKSPDFVYLGGPVEPEGVLALLRAPGKTGDVLRAPGKIADLTHVARGTYLASNRKVLEDALSQGKRSGELRVYLGYCGWTAGQLRAEVSHGAWYIFDPSDDIVFDPKPGSLWKRLIERTELQLASRR
jgi:putative transcriptional regulator